jgi:hypothetical protein
LERKSPAGDATPRGADQEEVLLIEHSVDQVTRTGDPFTPAHDDHDRPHACNDGWITTGQIVVDPETGEETEEYALYLCRRCADSR